MKPLLFLVALSASALAAVDPTQLAAARELYEDRSKSTEAQVAFAAIALADPANADAQLHLGWLALRRNDSDTAIRHLEAAVRLAPANPDYHHALGDTYAFTAMRSGLFSKMGFAKKCLAEYQRAVELAPDNVDFHQSLFEFYRRAPGLAGGSADKARIEATALGRLDPIRGHFALATLYSEDKKYDLAYAEIDAVLTAAPDHYNALFQMGRLAAFSDKYLDRGLTSFQRCLELSPGRNDASHANVQWRLGYLHEKKRDIAAARAAYEAALKLDPKFTAADTALKKLTP